MAHSALKPMEGWLHKRSGGQLANYHKRWVEVDPHTGRISYYDNERKKSDDPKGVISLWASGTHVATAAPETGSWVQPVKLLTGRLTDKGPDVTFVVHSSAPMIEGGKRQNEGGSFIFAAETPAVRAQWLEAIRAVIENNPETRAQRQKALRAMGLTTMTANAAAKFKALRNKSQAQKVAAEEIVADSMTPSASLSSTVSTEGTIVEERAADMDHLDQLTGSKSNIGIGNEWSIDDHTDEVQEAESFVVAAMKQKQKVRELLNGVMISSKFSQLEAGAPIIFRASTIVRAPAENVFDILNDVLSTPLWSPTIHKAELIEQINDTTGIYHIVFGPGTGIPAWLPFPQRDACVVSVGIREEDGSYTILQASTEHPGCPPDPRYVRANVLGTGYTITRRRPEAEGFAHPGSDCLLTQVSQMDYKLPLWFTFGANYFAGDENTRTLLDKARVAMIVALREYVEQGCFRDAGLGNEAYSRQKSLSTLAAHDSHYEPGSPTSADGTLSATPSMMPVTAFLPTGPTPTSSSSPPPPSDPSPTAAVPAVSSVKSAPGVAVAPTPMAKPRLPAMLSRLGGSMLDKFWREPDVSSMQVRGKNYLTDKKKVRASGGAKFKLLGVDLFKVQTPQLHIAVNPTTLMQKKALDVPFVFIVNLMVPGPPNYSVVCYFGASSYDLVTDPTPFGRNLSKFLAGPYEEQCKAFKLIPRVVNGSWIIKQAVGETPAIMGKKLKMSVYEGSNYVEVDIDIGSSTAANSIMRLVSPATKSLVVDLAFLLEGHKPEELPEEILGAVEFANVDLTTAVPL